MFENLKSSANKIIKSITTKRDNRLTPKPEFDIWLGMEPGIKHPEISPSLPLVKYVHDNSPSLKIATVRLRETIFRHGFEWEAKFKSKCNNAKCEKEFLEEKVDVCDECGSKTREPDESERQKAEDFFGTCSIFPNVGGQAKNKRKLLHVLKQIEDDLSVYDDAYIIGIKEYWQTPEGEIIFATTQEIIRGNPINMRMVGDEVGQLGGKWATCLRHRDIVEDIPPDVDYKDMKCKICGRSLYEIHYVSVEAGGEDPTAFYIGDEVIHLSKYAPSEFYGFSPIVTLWSYILTLTNMMEYVYRSYTKQHLPKGILAIRTSNPDSAYEFWHDTDDKLRKDPHYIPKMFIEGEGQTGSGVEFIRFMDSLEEMKYTEIRDEIRRTIAAMYGVTNIFIGDMGGVGGLNAEQEQVQITNMAAESALTIYNEDTLPEILRWLNIEDWDYILQSPFEQDRQRELNEQLMETQNASQMLMMGFDVELNEDGEFKFSGEAEKPQGMGDMGGGFGGDLGGGDFGNNNFEQEEKGLPEEPIPNIENEPSEKMSSAIRQTLEHYKVLLHNHKQVLSDPLLRPEVRQLKLKQIAEGLKQSKEMLDLLMEHKDIELPEETIKAGKVNINIGKGEKVYIKNPSEAPEGSKVQQGPKGGYYYESEGVSTATEATENLSAVLRDSYTKIRLAGLDKEINKVSDLVKAGKTSKNEFFDKQTNDYKPERKKLHDEIINKFLKEKSKYGEKEVILTGGPTASGKSSLLRSKGIDFDSYTVVNADDIQEHLPGYNGINAAIYHEEASDICKKLLQKALSENRRMIIDGTMRNYEKEVKKIQSLRNRSYKVKVVSLNADTKATIERATNRFIQEKRYVPLEHVANTTDNINKMQNRYKDLVDEFELWDSTTFPPKRKV